ncbi:tRNA (guanosine(37)-N1)-methyltransferase TrmD [Pseudolactococcus insecticola]|uniref:tRNA (guanine-N(1)-)-methyltransferase n=1 Tax=Pseudolactococcus insecticola TaxID=2709158 RepID=A0A6A0B7Y3_9LACT|nr:tRNA (guanosine(37)-N1)-methyltransferase TrmD [Lactococcus insecticola]GFH40773.1 tRNA (guanine-N(1)-)-methyltransferase [Lactococcus insecticola]
MRIDILTLFPEMFSALEHSIVGRAQKSGKIEVNFHNFRDFATNTQKHVDDMPYGGGQGMLLMPQPIFDTMASFPHENARVLMMDPAGRTFDQKFAEELSQESQVVFLCGHYEGFDERIKSLVTDEVSLGDYVLTGGEVAASVMIDATVRLIPDVLGKKASHEDDSFSSGLLEYPQYTRPEDFRGLKVPDVLMSGHHENIRKWRLRESLAKTLRLRPDLLEAYDFSDEEKAMLSDLKAADHAV